MAHAHDAVVKVFEGLQQALAARSVADFLALCVEDEVPQVPLS